MAETPTNTNLPAGIPKGAVKLNFPTVGRSEIDKFASVWDMKGIKMILDNTSRQFALDFANVVLKNFVMQQLQRSLEKSAQRGPIPPNGAQVATSILNANAAQPKPSTVSPSAPQTGKIILTDAS